MAKEITITDANNLQSFISFQINGLKDGILVGIPDKYPNCITIAYKGETKIIPFNAKTEDLEELNSDENVVKPSCLEAFDKFIQDIYSNKVDTEKVEACKKIFEGIDKVDTEVDDELTKTKQALDVAVKALGGIYVQSTDLNAVIGAKKALDQIKQITEIKE